MQYGVFLPNATNGYIISTGSPQYRPTFEHNLAITTEAEKQGLDFVLSMMKHHGIPGSSDFWGACLESFTLMAALASHTERLTLFPSVTTLATHPVLAARMVATIDEISQGRCGLNIVTGWNKPEYESMGLWPGDDYFDRRYSYAAEYVQVLRKLWSEGNTDFEGEHFTLKDCDVRPKPLHDVQIVCAGQSPKGQRFTAEHGDRNFIMAERSKVASIASGVKEIGRQVGRDVGTFALYCVIAEETDAEAEKLCQHILDHADKEAISRMLGSAELDTNPDGTSAQLLASLARPADEGNMAFLSIPVVKGSYESVARQFDEIAATTGIDGALLTWPDFVDGVTKFGERVMPLLTTGARTRAA
ncbi:LLM class flavin-dependent oxidoreductase [Pseudonocardia thermophila]|jgi:Coenzyme F420-dependent N5,N10-methylene tetrahydromethanopterin reductase and related flavin-dependent oxidoreductases|uniref:LLM class flavin-dependent oxidoreductase n=1 Tax=Pseudonocardia thermophila TaxID=1848 RepID=UPI00248E20E0|nr:LLM class flavin-dependent oxidoreductase [Pseudonocardia thermophila]